MIKLRKVKLDLNLCKTQLEGLKTKITGCSSIEEKDLQQFFIDNPQLLAIMGQLLFHEPTYYWQKEANFSKFRPDFVLLNEKKDKLALIEFEDAKESSIFEKKTESDSSVSYKWSTRFNDGYSQILDWMYAASIGDNLKDTFGFVPVDDNVHLRYALFLGWEKKLKRKGNLMDRFVFRKGRESIDGKTVYCSGFDQLYEDMLTCLRHYQEFADASNGHGVVCK